MMTSLRSVEGDEMGDMVFVLADPGGGGQLGQSQSMTGPNPFWPLPFKAGTVLRIDFGWGKH